MRFTTFFCADEETLFRVPSLMNNYSILKTTTMREDEAVSNLLDIIMNTYEFPKTDNQKRSAYSLGKKHPIPFPPSPVEIQT